MEFIMRYQNLVNSYKLNNFYLLNVQNKMKKSCEKQKNKK